MGRSVGQHAAKRLSTALTCASCIASPANTKFLTNSQLTQLVGRLLKSIYLSIVGATALKRLAAASAFLLPLLGATNAEAAIIVTPSDPFVYQWNIAPGTLASAAAGQLDTGCTTLTAGTLTQIWDNGNGSATDTFNTYSQNSLCSFTVVLAGLFPGYKDGVFSFSAAATSGSFRFDFISVTFFNANGASFFTQRITDRTVSEPHALALVALASLGLLAFRQRSSHRL